MQRHRRCEKDPSKQGGCGPSETQAGWPQPSPRWVSLVTPSAGDIDKGILQNIDIDKILYRLEYGISDRASGGWVGDLQAWHWRRSDVIIIIWNAQRPCFLIFWNVQSKYDCTRRGLVLALPAVLESTYFLSSCFFLSYFLMTKSKYDSRWRGFGQIRNQRGAAKGLRPAGKIQHSSSLSLSCLGKFNIDYLGEGGKGNTDEDILEALVE